MNKAQISHLTTLIMDVESDDELRGILAALGLDTEDLYGMDDNEIEHALEKADDILVRDIAEQVGMNVTLNVHL